MTSFAEIARAWPRDEAEAFLAAWRERAAGRSAWFADVVGDATGSRPATDLEGLTDAWRFLCARGFPGDEPPAPEPGWPEWYVAGDPYAEGLTQPDAWLVDGLVFFAGEVLIAEYAGVHWGMTTESMLAVYQQPILAGFWTGDYPKPLNVLNQMLRAVHRIRRGDTDAEGWLATFLARWADRATAPASPRTPGVDVTDVDVVPSEHATWDLEIWIVEGTEQALGRERFRSLRDRFAAIDAFAEVAWEDREVFLVRLAHPTSPEVAAAEVGTVMQELAAET